MERLHVAPAVSGEVRAKCPGSTAPTGDEVGRESASNSLCGSFRNRVGAVAGHSLAGDDTRRDDDSGIRAEVRNGFPDRREHAAGVRPDMVVEGSVGFLGERRLAGGAVVDAGVGDNVPYCASFPHGSFDQPFNVVLITYVRANRGHGATSVPDISFDPLKRLGVAGTDDRCAPAPAAAELCRGTSTRTRDDERSRCPRRDESGGSDASHNVVHSAQWGGSGSLMRTPAPTRSMDVTISPSRIDGRTRAPPSKSYTHRAILAAGYGGQATVLNPLVSADTKATMRAVDAFGGSDLAGEDESTVEVTGFDGRPETPDDVIDCANSGTTMRLVTATAALQDDLAVLTGDESLRSRPQGPLLDAIGQLNGDAESTRHNGQAPLVVGGGIDGGAVEIPGDVSSQYITALLMAGAVSPDGIDIDLTTELKSSPYVDITLEVLDAFGVDAEKTDAASPSTAARPTSPTAATTTSPGTSRR